MSLKPTYKASIVVMGKTGAGKSTLINAVLGKDVAPVGQGTSVTKRNTEYKGTIHLAAAEEVDLRIYDTVGLEIDDKITQTTISDIERHINDVESKGDFSNISAVWFCINAKCNRFEKYELDLIKKLSVDKCIPFVIVISQCLENRKGELEGHINEVIPEIPVARVLAKEYETRAGRIESYGIANLLIATIQNYPKLKVSVATSKFEKLCEDEKKKNRQLATKGHQCVNKYAEKAKKAGFLPVGCIPIVHGICGKMIFELNHIFGIKNTGEAWSNVVVGLVVTPIMAVPFISIAAAESYVETVGNSYVDALMNVVERYSNYRIEDSKMILEEIKRELKK